MQISRRTKLVIVSTVWVVVVFLGTAVVAFFASLGCPSTGDHMFLPSPEPACSQRRGTTVLIGGIAVGALPFVGAALRRRRRAQSSR